MSENLRHVLHAECDVHIRALEAEVESLKAERDALAERLASITGLPAVGLIAAARAELSAEKEQQNG